MKRYCVRNHDTLVVGRVANGQCRQCRSWLRRKGRPKAPRKQFCLLGHDTFEVGRYANGTCKRCDSRYRSPEVHKEVMVRQEQLPFPPLLKVLKQNNISFNSLDQANERAMQRYSRRGTIPLMKADAFCVDVLGVHPFDVWGPAFFEEVA